MTPCRDFQRGMCRFGQFCKFAHIVPGKNCAYWSSLGYCNKLSRCLNFHLPANCQKTNNNFSFVPIIESIWKVNAYAFRTAAAVHDPSEAADDASGPADDSPDPADDAPGPADDTSGPADDASVLLKESRSNDFNFNFNKPDSNLLTLERIVVMCSNTRGIQSKKKSVVEILVENNVDVFISLEMNTRKCPKIKGFVSFNHLVDKKFHGVSIFVKDSLAPSTMRIHDMSNNELVHIRITSVTPALNIVGLYMDVESRDSKEGMTEKVQAMRDKADDLIEKGEAVVVVGDINRPSIVKDYEKMTAGTKMFADWLAEGSMQLLNDLSIPTRRDPATGSESLLDVGLVSSNARRFVKEFKVDRERKMTPYTVIKKERRYTDHFALMINIEIPKNKKEKRVKNKPVINFGNKDGWPRYEEISNNRSGEVLEAVNSNKDIDVIEQEICRIEKSIQEEAFGIIWKKPHKKKKKKSQEEVREMVKDEYQEMQEMLEEGLKGKDMNKKMFKMKSLITGPKIERSEAAAISHPVTKDIIVDREEIKKVTLEHNVKILRKNEVPEEGKDLLEAKQSKHEEVMQAEDKDEWQLDINSYWKILKKLKQKGKKLYWLLTKAGDSYKTAIFQLLKKIVAEEEIPKSYLDTSLSMIWKKKGSPLDLNNMRFIHCKGYRPKVLEALVVENMKEKIIEATPNIQLGGMPGHSSAEHLVTLKTWMKFKEDRKENGIFTLFDLTKFFDKESLLDCLYELNKIGVSYKSYRLWYKLNENTRISVRTTVGETEKAVITDSIGQGSMGAALVSSMNIGRTLREVDKSEVEPSRIGSRVKISSTVFQDDIAKYSDTVSNARISADRLDTALKNKLLSVNYSKSKNLIIGSKKFRQKTLKDLQSNPIVMGGEVLEHASQEKYLGDVIDEEGCEASITATIKGRINKLYSKCEDIVKISENPLMASLGNARTPFKLFESEVIPALLFNAESWIGFNEKHSKLLQDFQDRFIRRVFQVHVSTPKAILNYDAELLPMKWRVAVKKISFVKKIMMMEDSNLARQALVEEGRLEALGMGFSGLVAETNELCRDLSIPSTTCLYKFVSKQDIKEAVQQKVYFENRQRMLESRKVRDRLDDEETFGLEREKSSYLDRLPLYLSRVMFRFRARAIQGVKYNTKGSHTKLDCRLCLGPPETQEHLQECHGAGFERRGLELENEVDLITFWRRISVKLQGFGLST